MRPFVQFGCFIGDANRRKGTGSSNTVGGSRTPRCIRYTSLDGEKYVLKNVYEIYLVT